LAKHWFTAFLTSHYTERKNLGLDLGCGRRNWEEFWNCDCIGIDLPANLSTGQGQHPEIFATAEYLPFKDNSFDFLSCYSVLSYVDNIDKTLDEIYRIIKPKGVVVIIVVNPRGMKLHKDIYWKNRLDSQKLEKILESHEFKSVKHKNLKTLIFSFYYNLTSVYAYAIVQPKKR